MSAWWCSARRAARSPFQKRTGESRRRASYSTTMSLPDTDPLSDVRQPPSLQHRLRVLRQDSRPREVPPLRARPGGHWLYSSGTSAVGRRSLTATAPFHRRAEDLDWQAALLPRVRLVSGWCRARRPLNKEVWQGREERRQGRLCGSRSDLIGRQRGRSSRRYQFGAGAGS